MDTAENCGIVGVVGGDDAVGFLLEGLTILRNRGYDSAGVASVGTSVDGLWAGSKSFNIGIVSHNITNLSESATAQCIQKT